MTALETAFNTMVRLLTAQVAWQQERLDKQQKILDASFTREQYDKVVNSELKANDQVHMLERRVRELERKVVMVRSKKRRRT